MSSLVVVVRLKDARGTLGADIALDGCLNADERVIPGNQHLVKPFHLPSGSVSHRPSSGTLILEFDPSSAGHRSLLDLYNVDEGNSLTGEIQVTYSDHSVTYPMGYMRHGAGRWEFSYAGLSVR